MQELARHTAITLRSFTRQPGMVLIVVLTLALGIGASTALFAYLAAITWPKIDAPEPERVVWVYSGTVEEPRNLTSYLDFLDLRRQQAAVRDIVGFSQFGTSMRQGQTAAFAWGQLVSGDFFSFFGTRPELGRLLVAGDDRPGAEPVAVVSHFFWKGTLGGDPGLIGQPLRLNGQSFTLVGVTSASFRGYGHVPALYVPLAQADRVTGLPRLENREIRMVSMLGRLAPGVTLEQAGQALALAGLNLDAAAPLAAGQRRISAASATTYDPGEAETGNYVDAAHVLMAAALLFLLLTCASVANLLLARATVREREWGIRASLGATRRRLVGAMLSESLVLCLAGGLLGMALAIWMARRIETYFVAPGGLGSWGEGSELVRFDLRVFAFAILVALACGVLCGLAPVLRVLRGDLLAAVKSDAAGIASGGSASALVPRKLLVIAQVGLSVLLLLGGSLLVRTLRNAERVDLGFDPGRVLMTTLYVPRSVGSAGEGASEVYRRVLEQAANLPGVESASLTYGVPLAGFAQMTRVAVQEQPDKPVEATYNSVSPGYFQTLGIRILQGRPLAESDRRDSPPVVVVSRELARKLWGEANPVGRLLSVPDLTPRPGEPGPVFEVVGVVQDAQVRSALEPPDPTLYFSIAQRSHPRLTLLVRAETSAAIASLAPELRRAVLAAHPDLSIVDLMTCGEQIRRSLSQQRMHAEVAGLFGILGLGVSVVGLFGLLSYTVSLRVREFGIRMAIGARPTAVELLVLRQGMGLVAVGLALGLAGALGLTRLLENLLFGVAANDPYTFAGVAAGLTLVTLFACYLPAHRAAQLDPLEALRTR